MNCESNLDFLLALFPNISTSVIQETLKNNSLEISVSILLDGEFEDDELMKLQNMFPTVDELSIRYYLDNSTSIDQAVEKILNRNENDKTTPEIERIILPRSKDNHHQSSVYFSASNTKKLSNLQALNQMFPLIDKSQIISVYDNCRGDLNQTALLLTDLMPQVNARDKFNENLTTLKELFPNEIEIGLISKLNRLKNVDAVIEEMLSSNVSSSRKICLTSKEQIKIPFTFHHAKERHEIVSSEKPKTFGIITEDSEKLRESANELMMKRNEYYQKAVISFKKGSSGRGAASFYAEEGIINQRNNYQVEK